MLRISVSQQEPSCRIIKLEGKLLQAWVDEVHRVCVEAEEGSTVVYLKAAYLKTLAAGKHTVTILSTSGNTSMDFTIGGKSSSPKTFDAGIGIYAVTAVLSVTGMAWTAKKRH